MNCNICLKAAKSFIFFSLQFFLKSGLFPLWWTLGSLDSPLIAFKYVHVFWFNAIQLFLWSPVWTNYYLNLNFMNWNLSWRLCYHYFHLVWLLPYALMPEFGIPGLSQSVFFPFQFPCLLVHIFKHNSSFEHRNIWCEQQAKHSWIEKSRHSNNISFDIQREALDPLLNVFKCRTFLQKL